MKKNLTAIICTVVAALTCFCAVIGFSACKKDGGSVTLLEENIIDDNYDNYYEIFVYSYCDSDGDGYGDLNGITQKLDYIRDMGYTGIWLMPIMPAASYHGYDVTDYYSVNKKYGTLQDYSNLITAAHEKGIKVIIDLVVNHTSSQHPWFTSAVNYKNGNGGNGAYADWYNFSETQLPKYYKNGNIWYEGQFDYGMPDLNLSNEAVRAEIDKIIKFWLEKGTDGFRLDGCLYYCDGREASVAVCKFIKDTASKYNKDAYIVGEAWEGKSTIEQFYESGADSFFYFPAAGKGDIVSAVNANSALYAYRAMNNCAKAAGDYIPAPFLSNHDNGVARIMGRMARNEEKAKFAYGLLSMFSGNTFTYYGDEIGMIAQNPASDPDLRVGMLWDNKQTNMTTLPTGAGSQYIYDGVAEQLKDKNSILNYYKLCNNARNAFPAIMRGSTERTILEDSEVLYITKTYKEQSLKIVINLGAERKKVEDIQGTLAQTICVTGGVKMSGTTLSMPRYSIAILT